MQENVFQKRVADVGMKIVRNKLWVMLCLAVVVGMAGAGLSMLRLDNSMEGLLLQKSPGIVDEAFKEVFGKRDMAFMLVESDNIFSHETLSYIDRVSKNLEKHLPVATEVVSLTHMSYIDVVDDTLRIENLLAEGVPQSRAALSDIRRRVMNRPLLVDVVITADNRPRVSSLDVLLMAQINGLLGDERNQAGVSPSLQYEVTPQASTYFSGSYSITDQDILLHHSMIWDTVWRSMPGCTLSVPTVPWQPCVLCKISMDGYPMHSTTEVRC